MVDLLKYINTILIGKLFFVERNMCFFCQTAKAVNIKRDSYFTVCSLACARPTFRDLMYPLNVVSYMSYHTSFVHLF